MSDKEPRSVKIKAFNTLCSCLFIGSVVYILVAGFEVLAIGFLVLSLASVATPVVLAGDTASEILLGILEAIVEGVVAIVEGFVSVISNIFG